MFSFSVVDVPPSNVGRPLPPAPVSKTEPSSSRPLPTVTIEKNMKKESNVKTSEPGKQQQQTKPSAPIQAWKEDSQSSTSNHSSFAFL